MTSRHSPLFRYRLALLISMVLIVPIGYAVRFSQNWGTEGLRDGLGSVAYELFWILLGVFLFPRASVKWVAIGVFLATCGLEFLQLWQPPFLQALRATLPGRLVLGTTFTLTDFPAYGVGSVLGWVWVIVLRSKFGKGSKVSPPYS